MNRKGRVRVLVFYGVRVRRVIERIDCYRLVNNGSVKQDCKVGK